MFFSYRIVDCFYVFVCKFFIGGLTLIDYFDDLVCKLNDANKDIKLIKSNIVKHKKNYLFDLFEFEISDKIKYLYNNYKVFLISWENDKEKLNGFIDFISYEEILNEHKVICNLAENIEKDLIEEQERVINDLKCWYPIFKFPNGDAFCYDNRNGKVVFFEHEVFDTGINLHGLIIAESIDVLLENWSEVLFIDIYDWYEGVDEQGINLRKNVYSKVLKEIK